jgi:signal transduction histidine kinase
LNKVAEALVQHLDVAFVRIWTLNDAENVLELQASAGMYTRIDGSHSRVPVGKLKIGLIAEERKPHFTNAVIGDPLVNDQEWAKRERMVAFAGHPLTIEDKLVGVMAMFSRKPITDITLKALASVSNEIAIGIERKLAEEELKKHRDHLEELVKERTVELNNKNEELTENKLALISLVEELNRATEELIKAKDRAEAADRLKSIFLATMSHELRTPLNSIIGFTGILLQGFSGPLNDEQNKQLEMVKNSGNHLLSLINDVLDISKIEAGQLKIDIAPFDMSKSIETVVQIVTPLARTKELALHVEITSKLGVIVSDKRRVEQILLNLLSNAIKFTEKGEVKVECQVSGGQVITRVIDTGIGIKPENMDRLFKPFIQLETGLARRFEGTGLGLSISKRLVEMLGGTIRVESEIGKGSVFTFTLPLKREAT